MPVNATIFATGNNLVIAGDLTRRTLLCSLDAGCEHPEQRSFDTDIAEHAHRKRDRLVAAALTVLRAWHMAGEAPQAKPLGSFEDWSYRVREPLLWLGHADPCDTMIKVKAGDPARAALTAVAAQWKENFGIGTQWTVQDILTRSFNVTELHTALTVAACGAAGVVNNRTVGRWLKKVEGRIVDGLTLRQAGVTHGYPLWCLTEAAR
jgi:putative DNA primase/helicase